MKKNGFTLAEVLITLAIIGVVATLTLPALMSNTQEQQAVTAFRKAMNTLNEVGQMNAAVDGFDYTGVTAATAPSAAAVYDANGVLNQSVWGMLVSKAQIDVPASVDGGIPGGCTGLNQAFFRDGTVLCYGAETPSGVSSVVIPAVVDTNGRKAPNILSTCGDVNCATAAQKTISDQFAITLRGASAIPGTITIDANGTVTEGADGNSLASRWAMRK